MQPFHVSEIKETHATAPKIPEKTKAFEKTTHEVGTPRHLDTINEKLEGQKHPETGVKFEKHKFTLNGECVEGVFPKFESKFDAKLPKDLYKASDTVQFKYCTERLKEEIAKNPDMEKEFTPRQLDQIKNGEPRIGGLTWHHNEIPGKMQLVNADVHAATHHTGGRSIWGGGAEFRKD